jgi:small-conductance mechanosensitive channel
MEIPASSLVAVVSVLLCVATTHVVLRWWMMRHGRLSSSDPSGVLERWRWRRWIARTIWRLWPTVAVLLWIQGLYLSLGLVVRQLEDAEVRATVLTVSRLVYGVAVVAAIVWMLARAGRLIEEFLIALTGRADTAWDDLLLPLAGKAVRHTLPLLALILAAPAFAMSPAATQIIRNGTSLVLIALIAWILLQAVEAAAAMILQQHRIDVSDNLRARSIYTQVMVLKKVAATAIGVFGLASMLMVFDSVRQFGTSILASAGVAGLVVGFAAQRSIATLLAGFQIAMTQPIRVDDVVIVESEWGRIEEITLTYVVVRIWDERRLVVPIGYFIEQPFQNWTRTSAAMLAPVFLHLDYTVRVEVLRDELTRILTQSALWDGKVNVLQVTEATEHSLQVRALASAADAGRAWDLRCEIREQMIRFVQQAFPEALPRLRASVERPRGADTRGRQPAFIARDARHT